MEFKIPLYILSRYCPEDITNDILDNHLKNCKNKEWYIFDDDKNSNGEIKYEFVRYNVDLKNLFNKSQVTKEYILGDIDEIGIDIILNNYENLSNKEINFLMHHDKKFLIPWLKNDSNINKIINSLEEIVDPITLEDKKINALIIIKKHKNGIIVDGNKLIESIKLLKE